MMWWGWELFTCLNALHLYVSVSSPMCVGTARAARLEKPCGKQGTSGSLLDPPDAQAGYVLSPDPCSPSNLRRIRREGSEHRT